MLSVFNIMYLKFANLKLVVSLGALEAYKS